MKQHNQQYGYTAQSFDVGSKGASRVAARSHTRVLESDSEAFLRSSGDWEIFRGEWAKHLSYANVLGCAALVALLPLIYTPSVMKKGHESPRNPPKTTAKIADASKTVDMSARQTTVRDLRWPEDNYQGRAEPKGKAEPKSVYFARPVRRREILAGDPENYLKSSRCSYWRVTG